MTGVILIVSVPRPELGIQAEWGYLLVLDVFRATAARMSVFSAFSLIFSPSWKSMARLTFPSRLELNEARRILEGRPLGEGHLHDALVGLPRADNPVVIPGGNAAPFPLLDDFGVGFVDESTEPAEHLATPVAELLDPRVDQLRRRLVLLRPTRRHGLFFPSSANVAWRSGLMVIAQLGLQSRLPGSEGTSAPHRARTKFGCQFQRITQNTSAPLARQTSWPEITCGNRTVIRRCRLRRATRPRTGSVWQEVSSDVNGACESSFHQLRSGLLSP